MSRAASAADVHRVAAAMPHVTVTADGRVYQVGGRSFVFFRTPRGDAVDPVTGERYDDVVVLWVAGEDDKQALVRDETSPYFTTPHFDGHPSVLVRCSRLHEVDVEEVTELVQEAWLSQASARRARAWSAQQGRG